MTEASLAHHMAAHIMAMSVVAPAAAGAWRWAEGRPRAAPAPTAGMAALAQIALLWGWHAPPALALAVASPAVTGVMHASLFLAALWFWRGVLAAAEVGSLRPLLAILMTGKLLCLLGALLVFAPRPIYREALLADASHATGDLLSDQQMAGLMMLVACPFTYILAAVILAARWLGGVDRAPAWRIARSKA